MDKIDYMFFKLQTCCFDNYIGNIYIPDEQEVEKQERLSKISNSLPILIEKYNLSLMEVQKYFENKYQREFNEENILLTFFDKIYLNKKFAYLLEMKNILPPVKVGKEISEQQYQSYRIIIDMYMEKKIKHRSDGFYSLNIPIKYFEKKDFEFLSQYRLLGRAGFEISAEEKLLGVLLAKKFEEFNFLVLKFKEQDMHSISKIIFKLVYSLNKENIDLDDYIQKWKEICFPVIPDFFEKILKLNKEDKSSMEEVYNGLTMSSVFAFLPSKNNIYSQQDLANTYQFIHRYSIIDEKIALNKIINNEVVLNENKIKPKKRI